MSEVSTKQLDVLIVGAGAAGLAAAREISATGARVAVVEARDRTGGRIYTIHDNSLAVPLELGAEFIHGKPPELLETIESSPLLLSDTTARHWYVHDGCLVKSGDFWAKVNEMMARMKEVGPYDLSFRDFLNQSDEDETTKEVALRYVEGFHAARPERISVHSLVQINKASDRIDGDKQFRLLNGYDGFTDRLSTAAELQGATIHLNTVVKEVRWRKGQVNLVCRSENKDRHFIASRAVITLPLGVLQARPEEMGAVRFVPALPRDKEDAIHHLAMGHVLKFVLRFRERFWEKLELPVDGGSENLWELGFIHAEAAVVPTWWTQLPVRAPVLVGWVGGPVAEGLLSHAKESVFPQAIDSIAQILGVTREYLLSLLQSSHVHQWSSDPLARGAYSYIPVNGLRAQATLIQPLDDTLFFAGEATSQGHIGTVHGAVASGKRAASELLNSMN